MPIRCEDIVSHPEFRRLSTAARRRGRPSLREPAQFRRPRPVPDARLRLAASPGRGGRGAGGRAPRRSGAGPSPAGARRAAPAPGPDRALGLSRRHRACASTSPTRRAARSTRSAWRSTRRCSTPPGRELDMGSGFDEMTELSHPQLEARHLASGALTAEQHRARELLRGVLAARRLSRHRQRVVALRDARPRAPAPALRPRRLTTG